MPEIWKDHIENSIKPGQVWRSSPDRGGQHYLVLRIIGSSVGKDCAETIREDGSRCYIYLFSLPIFYTLIADVKIKP